MLTFAAVATAWLQPKYQRWIEKVEQRDRLRERVSLYLDVFELKLAEELALLAKRRGSSVAKGAFEEENRINFHALEGALDCGTVLLKDEFRDLLGLVTSFKVSKNMHGKTDIERFCSRIRAVRPSFPSSQDLTTFREAGESRLE